MKYALPPSKPPARFLGREDFFISQCSEHGSLNSLPNKIMSSKASGNDKEVKKIWWTKASALINCYFL